MSAHPEPDAELAASFAGVALANVRAEYPYHLVHLARSPGDVATPRELYPVFWGSYDWHSCVHMHWTLARCLRLYPSGLQAAAIRAHFDTRLLPHAVMRELDYLRAPGRTSFERPYGWGWLLKLADELGRLVPALPAAAAWRDALAPLALEIADRFLAWLPRQDYAVRAGTHGNSAFALLLALDYAQGVRHPALARAVAERANRWFARDCRYPADYEPGGDEFLSGGLCEAELVRRTLDGCDFADWWETFCPAPEALAHWLQPVAVSDPTDAKIVHLHGLNLSRAWCWRLLLPLLPAALQPAVQAAVTSHLGASLAAATAGHYVGTHWLASFALLALSEPSDAR